MLILKHSPHDLLHPSSPRANFRAAKLHTLRHHNNSAATLKVLLQISFRVSPASKATPVPMAFRVVQEQYLGMAWAMALHPATTARRRDKASLNILPKANSLLNSRCPPAKLRL